MTTDKRSDDSVSDDWSASITRRPFLRSLAGVGALSGPAVPAISGPVWARPPGPVPMIASRVAIRYNNCGVATVLNASSADSLSIYYADDKGNRHLQTGIDPTTGDQQSYRPIIVEYSQGSDKTNIQITRSGYSIVRVIAEWDDGRTACTNEDCMPDGFNSPPTVSLTAETGDTGPVSGSIEVDVDEQVTFDSNAEDPDLEDDSSPDVERLRYEWDFGEDAVFDKPGKTATGTYNSAGTRTVTLCVTDDFGASKTATLDLTVRKRNNWTQSRVLGLDESVMFSRFGSSVAVSDGAFVAGARLERFNEDTHAAGAVYVYKRTGDSSDVTRVVSDNPTQEARFGTSVAISEGTIGIGSTEGAFDGNKTGTAYLYENGDDPGSLTTLVPSGLSEGDRYGASVAISNDSAVVGAPSRGNGAAFQFDLDGGSSSSTELVPSGLAADDGFGTTVDVSSGVAVVGASGTDDSGTDAGAAYMFELDENPITTTKFGPAGRTSGDQFGSAVAVSGGTVVVGAPGVDGTGAAYVYDTSDLSAPRFVLAPSDSSEGDQFGSSVAISGETVVVGAPGTGDVGAAYVHNLDAGPGPVETLAPEGSTGVDGFGDSVAALDGTAVVGAPRSENDGAKNAGLAYVFER